MSLNEIVNCPSKYVSHTPYLVVQHIDWIQCRYLLVQVQNTESTTAYSTNTVNDAVNRYVERFFLCNTP
jgi:ubiquitin-conjugating enzyme E2 Q